MKFLKKPLGFLFGQSKAGNSVQVQSLNLFSEYLDRDVILDIYLPPGFQNRKKNGYPFVLFNDGQDLWRMNPVITGILENLYTHKKIPPILAIGVHASQQRMREYGTASQADYKGRGDKAGVYESFIKEELHPFLNRHLPISDSSEDAAIAGFSLGGLSAFDIGWSNPELFGKIGVFSGALWWRSSAVRPEDPDADRIMHEIVRQTKTISQKQRIWFQCGTLDETEDRNNNGIIDSIDDTKDLIKCLIDKGVKTGSIRYLEIENGHHDPITWGHVIPDFLEWSFNNGE